MKILLILNLLILNIIQAEHGLEDMTKYYLESRNTSTYDKNLNKKEVHYSHFLHELLKHGQSLPSEYIDELGALGFRTDGNFITSNRPQLGHHIDDGLFRYHYSITGNDAIDTTDANNSGIADYLEFIIKTFNQVNVTNFDSLNYLIPPSDGWYTTQGNGGSKHYDVYIFNLEAGYYGYVQGEDYAQNNSQILRGDNENSETVKENSSMVSFMALRNDYSSFPGNLNEILEVTIAHEFFHAIQYGYDGWEAGWLLESTAVWMEELHFDHINDCYQFLNNNFDYPEEGLFYDTNRGYGSYIFFSYLEDKHLGINFIKDIFEQSVNYYSYDFDFSLYPVLDVLEANNLNISEIFNNLSITNIILDTLVTPTLYQFEETDIQRINQPYIAEKFTIIEDSILSFSDQTIWSSGTVYYELINLDSTLETISTKLIDSEGSDSGYNINSIKKISNGVYEIGQGLNQKVNLNYNDTIIFAVTFYNGYSFSPSNYSIAFGKNYTFPILNDSSNFENNLSIEQFDNYLKEYSLELYPNPFNPITNIQFTQPNYSKTKIQIFNTKGELVSTLLENYFNPGTHSIAWNAKNLSSGVYFISVESDGYIQNGRLILVK